MSSIITRSVKICTEYLHTILPCMDINEEYHLGLNSLVTGVVVLNKWCTLFIRLKWSKLRKVTDTVSRWDYIVGYLPDVWKFGLFPTFNAAKIVLISYLDNIFGLQSHTKPLQSKKSIFTLMESHIDNSENSIIMSFKDKKIIYEAFWMFKTLYLMVP